ncbi:MAG: 30S ribosomal protein S17 [Nitrospirae bacterium]|nr:30S ribosomal protein S17 [Nitrospirota bacterium]
MRTKPRTTTGKIISDKMNKTVVVGVTRFVPHPLYGKIVRKLSKFKAHDEKNEAKVGDIVKIVHTRPLSKDKSWRVAEIVERGEKSRALNK